MNPLDSAKARGATCPECGTADALRLVLMESGPHHAKIVCDNCNERFVTWAAKTNKPPTRRDGRRKDLLNVIRSDRDDEPLYCEICLVDERTLPTGVWLEAHHILEHQDGGTDNPRNLMPVCNRCHTLIHWLRKAFGTETQVGKETESVTSD